MIQRFVTRWRYGYDYVLLRGTLTKRKRYFLLGVELKLSVKTKGKGVKKILSLKCKIIRKRDL